MSLLQKPSERFRELPIRRKLRITFLLTTVIALLLAGAAIVTADSLIFYNYLRRDLATFVQIIGDNTTGALAFDDARAARETLAALSARSHVQIACLYERSGGLLAKYTRADFNGACPAARPQEIVREHGVLVASRHIQLAGRPLGALVLQYDLDEIVERVELFGAMVVAVLLISCAMTIALSTRLQALIARPILELAATARAVSGSKDYSIRARKQSQDELGTLADALNLMMEGIQSRDSELRMALEEQRRSLDRLARLNADLEQSNIALAHSNSDLERFAFMASHDLQEPLRMITLYSQLLVNEHLQAEGPHNEFVEHIIGGTRRMRELLSDLLAYTEITGAADHPLERVDLNVVLERVRETLSIIILEAHAEVTADPLPVLNAHQSRMTSLIQNLVGNAIKYRADRPPKIRISCTEDDKHFAFAVTDNGIGIEPEYQEKIFVAFQRLHGKEIPGTGIGLAICQRIVERYGGQIWVESEFGSGSTFRFTLPKSMAGRLA